MEGHYPHHLHQQQQQELHQFQLQQFQVAQQPQLLPHHHQQQQHLSPPITVHVDAGDRFPQWSVQETKELITIRAELDQTFMETKRNKQLWEVIATRMKDKGHNRSAEQCKCKWKNLVTRYKGCETAEAEAMRQQFPFFNDLAAIMVARNQRMVWAEGDGAGTGGGSKKKAEATVATVSSSDEDDHEDSEEEKGIAAPRKKKKVMKVGHIGSGSGVGTSGSNYNVKEILDEFMRQQVRLDMQLREEYRARESERQMREFEWRQTMEALENERIMMERNWREREGQRRIREEARAEKRDALISALLDKLNRGDM